MAITLSGTTVAVDAPQGTIVGTFNTDGLRLKINPNGWFVVVGRLLATTWTGQAVVGPQTILVQASGGLPATFTINITAAAAPPPAPTVTGLTLTPAAPSLADTVASGTTVATAAVTMSDGSSYTGAIQISPTSSLFAVSGLSIKTARGMTAADDGAHAMTISAGGKSAALNVTITAASAPPPASPSITVNGMASGAAIAPSGSAVLAVANGPGNPLDWVSTASAGSADTSYLSWAYLASGTQSAPSSGVKSGSVTLTAPSTAGNFEARFSLNNGFTVAARSPFSVTAPAAAPVIAVTLANPSIPDTTPKGAVVGTFTVNMSDGSPFTGTARFGPPNNDAGGIFALDSMSTTSGILSGRIIVSPTGPGVGPNTATVTDHITIEAS